MNPHASGGETHAFPDPPEATNRAPACLPRTPGYRLQNPDGIWAEVVPVTERPRNLDAWNPTVEDASGTKTYGGTTGMAVSGMRPYRTISGKAFAVSSMLLVSGCVEAARETCSPIVTSSDMEASVSLIAEYVGSIYGEGAAESLFETYQVAEKSTCGRVITLRYEPRIPMPNGVAVVGAVEKYTVNLDKRTVSLEYID